MSTVDLVDNIVKVITPLIGVACGVYLVPITEKMKSKAATLQLLLNYQEELKDVERQAKKLAIDLYDSQVELTSYKSGESDTAIFNGLNTIDVYFLNDVLKSAYSQISFDERKAIKALICLVKEFNGFNNQLVNLVSSKNEVSLDFKKSIKSAASIYWICNKLNNTSIFKYSEDHDNQLELNKALKALGIPPL
ncbi:MULTISPECIES: hypothetical protein [Aeromonas]|nr:MULTISPECIES: hypothetical protein [Aeromonas]MBL0629716.1 hypothetical protein [Aeromonas veronii]MCQ4052914.1 hypothetical protein [Aeromonas sp. SG16]